MYETFFDACVAGQDKAKVQVIEMVRREFMIKMRMIERQLYINQGEGRQVRW